MRAYELMLIADGELDESGFQGVINRTHGLIAGLGGAVAKTDKWGKRRFAYEINKRHEGYYVVIEFTAAGTGLDNFEQTLRFADDIVRHKLIRLPDHEAARRGLVGAGVSADAAE